VPARAEHARQARANRAHARFLLGARPADPTAMQWAVTAAFYCAVHCVEAHLAAHGTHSRTHVLREAAMADPRNGVPPHVYVAYRRLQQRSEGARYFLQQFSPTRVRQEILGQLLPTVTGFVKL
jgi:hypothetical protein